MQTQTEAPATAQNGESIQTDAAPAQPQPHATPDRTAAGSTSAAGSERDAGTIVPPLNAGTISKLEHFLAMSLFVGCRLLAVG
jgi:hypothetical protein